MESYEFDNDQGNKIDFQKYSFAPFNRTTLRQTEGLEH